MQGRGLIRGKVQPALGSPNKGLSVQLDALAAYSNSHKVSLSPFSRGGLSEAAKHGREVFSSAKTKCASCHGGAFYSDSRPRAVADIVRHDVGTGDDDPSEKMGPAFDTPTLLGVYRTAPYLHHGKATTLEEIITKYNPHDRHGVTSHLTKSERSDLIEFLKALPFEDPLLTGPSGHVGD
jgi:cytochrome c peroxidase